MKAKRWLPLGFLLFVACGGDDTGDVDAGPIDGADAGAAERLIESAPARSVRDDRAAQLQAEVEALADLTLWMQVEATVHASTSGALSPEPQTEVEGFMNAGVELMLQQNTALAALCFLRAYELEPDDPLVLSQLGFAFVFLDRAEEARAFLLRARELEPKLLSVLLSLGRSYELDGDYIRAMYFYNAALGAHPEVDYTKLPLARVMLAGGRPGAAKALLEEIDHLAAIVDDIGQLEAELADAPPPESVDPESPPEIIVDPSGGLRVQEFFQAQNDCILAWLQDTTDHVTPIGGFGGAMMQVDQDVQARFDDSGALTTACEAACGPNAAEICYVTCWQQQCGRDMGIYTQGRADYFAEWQRYYAAHSDAANGYEGCMMDAYYEYQRYMADDLRKLILDHIWDFGQESIYGRREVYEGDVVVTVEYWYDIPAASCDLAQTAIDDLTFEDFIPQDPNAAFDVCGYNVCVQRNDRGGFTVEGNVGPWSVTASSDASGKLTATIGKQVWSKGSAEVGLFARFDGRSGQSDLTMEGKITGPVTGLSASYKTILLSSH